MDQSRRAVEAYWRSRLIDGVTEDEDNVAPVYKLEEVCELLRSSPAGIVKEVSDYILKRVDHKSPIVKQKALRLIKYAVGKSGNEFRREMQRHSAAVRQLFHYKRQLDPLKGDALNKAVRDTAHEAIAAIFATDDNKAVAPIEGLSSRIQGFGNPNFQTVKEDKKSFLSEVVGLSSASIKQGLSTIASATNDQISYKSPTLNIFLTTETDRRREYEGNDQHRQSWVSSGVSGNMSSETSNYDSRPNISSTTSSNDETSSSILGVKSREERLLETIVTSGGVRLQPTREAIHAFLTEASKLDALSMIHALETKLQSNLWRVRMKAICVLESMLRRKAEEYFSIITSYFNENRESVVRCTEMTQVSLREKAIKVLSLLDDELTSGARISEESSNFRTTVTPVVQMPDLIDSGDLNTFAGEDATQVEDGQGLLDDKQPGFVIDDLFGGGPLVDPNSTGSKDENDPFSDVSFHVSDKEQDDLFTGLTVDDKQSDKETNLNSTNKSELLDFFGVNAERKLNEVRNDKSSVNDLMASMHLSGMAQETKQPGLVGASAGSFSLGDSSQQSQLHVNGASTGNLGFNTYFPQAPMQNNMPSSMMFNQGFTQPMNYGAMGAFIAQQQILLQNLGNLNPRFDQKTANSMEGSYDLHIPDIFQLSNHPVQSHTSVMNNSKEENRAFDFISDHHSAARDSKKLL